MSDIGAPITTDNISTVLAYEAVLIPLSRRVNLIALWVLLFAAINFILTRLLAFLFIVLVDRIFFGCNFSLTFGRLLLRNLFTLRIFRRRVLVIMFKSFLTSVAATTSSLTCCNLHVLFLCTFGICNLLSTASIVRLISWELTCLVLGFLLFALFITWLKILHEVVPLEIALLESGVCRLLLAFVWTLNLPVLTLSVQFGGFIFIWFVCAVNLSYAKLLSRLLKNP